MPVVAAFLSVLVSSCSRAPKLVPTEAKLAPVVATASVDKALATTEDNITFTVVVNRDAGAQVTLPDIGSRITGLRITDFGTDEKSEDQRKIARKWFTLRADVAGSYILPEVAVTYQANGKEETVKTSEIFVEVKAPKEASSPDVAEDLRDIKDLEASPVNYAGWGIGLLVLVLGIVGFLYYRRRKKAPPAPVRLPAHEVALQRLQVLAPPDGVDSAALKRYYFSLSEILRAYVEERYGVPATDMTSEEIARRLRTDSPVPETEKPVLLDLLKDADIVKFTDFLPPESARSAARNRAMEFVVKTAPGPVAPQDAVREPGDEPGALVEESVV